MPPSRSPLVRVAAQFGYDLDETSLLTNLRTTHDTRAARLCAVLVEQATSTPDTGLRYTISQDPDRLYGPLADTVTAIEHAWRAIAVLLTTAVTTDAARQLTPAGTRTAESSPWRPGVVRIADAHGGPYPCQLPAPGWNGWARPRFTRDVVTRLITDLHEDWRRSGHQPDLLPGQVLDSGDVLLIHDEDVQETVGPDEDDMFAVGAGSWRWEEWPN